ncbi:MAG TPA: amidohydrolase family protein [Steroidobacter sp.]|uniref:metal-dependent hydrolase family protein n=1 Tax=Steroidobacter sp. TaxID=1978227 RepID=UPI002ED77896
MQLFVIANVRIFDGVDRLGSDANAVWIEHGRIARIGASEAIQPHERVIDGRGMTLMPGLIDAHFHCNSPAVDIAAIDRLMPSHLAQYARRYLEDMLARGFTTLRDAGGADMGLVRALQERLIRGPRLFVAGKALSQSGGHGDFRPQVLACGCETYEGSLTVVVDGPDDVRVAVRNLLRTGAHQVKIMVSGGVLSPMDPIWMDQYTDQEIIAAIEEAARWRSYVMAHSLTDNAARRCAQLGVRSIEHGLGITADTASFLAERGTFVVPTLGTPHWLLQGVVPIPPASRDKCMKLERSGAEAIENCAAAGVRLGFGTDLLGDLHGREAHELVFRAEVSGALETLRSATSINAELMQLSGEIGRVAVGAHADLLLVDGDPLADISILTKPETHLKMIFRDGEIVADRLH